MLRGYFLDQSLALKVHSGVRRLGAAQQCVWNRYILRAIDLCFNNQAIQSSLAQLVARSAVTRFRHTSDVKLHSIPEG
jgi:hypothetical protein